MKKFYHILNILIILFLIPIYAHLKLSNELFTKTITPIETIVDTTNSLSYRIMYYHSLANRNNFAFSPTSLISVIIALYEGSNGRSYSELQNFLELPQNKDILRIGLRDIHRKLRTYSFPQDNPLIGLILNKENVTVTAEYEAILKFYGYDLNFNSTEIQTFISEVSIMATTYENDTLSGKENNGEINLKNSSISTLNTVTEADTVVINQTSTNITTLMPLQDNIDVEISTTSTESITTLKIPDEIMTTATDITTTSFPQLAAYIRPKTNLNSNKSRKKQDFWPTSSNISVQNTQKYLNTNNKNQSERSDFQSRKLISQVKSVRNKRFLINEFKTVTNIPYTLGNFKNFGSLIINDGDETFSDVIGTFEIPEVSSQSHLSILNPYIESDINLRKFGVDVHSVSLFPKEASLKNTINHIFYLRNHETVQTNYKTYNSILNYKYLSAQKLTILELELNSINYNLMIFLPDLNIDIDTTVAYLKYIPNLRNLRKQMRPKWVQAIIPDIKLKGKMYLTNDLQNMGIKDIFEPSRADLSLMTNENDIYVKHIEQIINVNIRTKPVNQVKRNIAQQFQPIEVAVNHPFLFFIVDKEIDVAILGGRILNPLNLRIQ